MNEHLGPELVAYLDDELDAEQCARVEAHLRACPQCAAELARLQDAQAELASMFDTALGPVRLPAEADRRIRRRLRPRAERRPWWGLWRRRALVVQAVLTVLIVALTLNTYQVVRMTPPQGPQETLVLGQERWAPGSRAALRVLVRSAEAAQPIDGADVVVRVGRTPGLARTVYTGRTGADGTAQVSFDVPSDLTGEAALVVETSSSGGGDQIVRPITIARDYKIFLTTDKPAYRPGQTLHLRALVFDGVDLTPVVGDAVAFSVHDPAGERVAQRRLPLSDFGVAALDFPLPEDATHGPYILRATLGDTISERTVNVEDYELPAFRLTLETARDYYLPGERVRGSVRASYFFGKPVSSGTVTLSGYLMDIEGGPVTQISGALDETGQFAFAFDLPPTLDALSAGELAYVQLGVEVTDDAGQQEGLRRVVPVAAQDIQIDAVPESGWLKPGVENVVFLLTAHPDGRPVETVLSVRVDDQTHQIATDPYGLAEFRYVPRAGVTRFEVDARGVAGGLGSATFAFESDPGQATQALLLRAERALYAVGETLRLEALTAGLEPAGVEFVYVDVVRARQTVATLSAPLEEGRATFALDLDAKLVGTLELHAYAVLPDGTRVGDARVVAVDAPRQVLVDVTADRERYRPGDTAQVELETALSSTGQPVEAALGIGVVDESVHALETLPSRFAQAYFLLEQELLAARADAQVFRPAEALGAGEATRAAQDVAAQATWAGVRGAEPAIEARSTATLDAVVAARAALSRRLGWAQAALALGLGLLVARRLQLLGLLAAALRRAGVGLVLVLLAAPVWGAVGAGLMWLAWALLGVAAPLALLGAALLLLGALTVHAWRRHGARLRVVWGLVLAYLLVSGLLIYQAAPGGALAPGLLVASVASFLVALLALIVLGQGLVVEGYRRAGWGATLLVLLLVALAVYLPFVPALDSELARALGNPALYAGPVGWITGCAPMAEQTPAAVEVEVTQEVEAETEVEVTQEAVVTPAPTEAPAPTPSPQPAPAEPYPLRQVFPETLYWDPEARTGADGRLSLDLPLADNITTWRLTALASTRGGELGVATYDLVVFQDFFVALDLPEETIVDEMVTVEATLRNYTAQSQDVALDLSPADWYTLLDVPEPVTVPAEGARTVRFTIRPERVGAFSLELTASGTDVVDRVSRAVTVRPAP